MSRGGDSHTSFLPVLGKFSSHFGGGNLYSQHLDLSVLPITHPLILSLARPPTHPSTCLPACINCVFIFCVLPCFDFSWWEGEGLTDPGGDCPSQSYLMPEDSNLPASKSFICKPARPQPIAQTISFIRLSHTKPLIFLP